MSEEDPEPLRSEYVLESEFKEDLLAWTCGDRPCGALGGNDHDGPTECDHVPCGWSSR